MHLIWVLMALVISSFTHGNNSTKPTVFQVGNEIINEESLDAVRELFSLSDFYKNSCKDGEKGCEDDSGQNQCKLCKQGLAIGKRISMSNKGNFKKIMKTVCQYYPFKNSDGCDYYQGRDDLSHSTFASDISNVLSLIDPHGDDGAYLCHYMLGGLCKQPELKTFDISHWWPDKPDVIDLPKSRNETFNVLHISDIHYSIGYREGTEADCSQFMCCVKDSISYPGGPSRRAPRYGYYRCDTPEILMEDTLNETVNRDIDYEFTIFTGDMVDHNPIFVSLKDSIREEDTVMRKLKSMLNNTPVYSALGNHDSYPFSQVAQHKSGFSQLHQFNSDLMANLWEDAHWITSKKAQQVREHYGGYAVTTKRGLRIISLNSNFWYRFNFYNYWDTEIDPDTSGTFKFLVKELIKAEIQSQKVWIIAHVPTGGLATDALPIATRVFTQIIERFNYIIASIFFGHTHQDEFTVFYSGNGSVKSVKNALNIAWIGPSVTPYVNYNPSWRYYVVNSDTFEVIDSITYYSRLDDTFSSNHSPEWYKEYSARETYQELVPELEGWPKDAPLNATFWHYVAKGIRDNPDTAQMYADYGYRLSPHTPDCTGVKCRLEQYCFVTSMDVSAAKQCRMEYNILDTRVISALPKNPMPRPMQLN